MMVVLPSRSSGRCLSMIANFKPNVSAGHLRAEVAQWREVDEIPDEFLVLIDPRENSLLTLLQIAKLHAANAWEPGCDLTFGDVDDASTRYMAFTYRGSREDFWYGLSVLTEQVILDAEGLEDEHYPSQRAFGRMLMSFGIPPLEVLPAVGVSDDGTVLVDAEWEELM